MALDPAHVLGRVLVLDIESATDPYALATFRQTRQRRGD